VAEVRPIGRVSSPLVAREDAPKQGFEGAPDAQIHIEPEFRSALEGITGGQEILVLTWLHRADRTTLVVHPRDDPRNPLTGVFATRSADRPNPIGLHPVTVLAMKGQGVLVVRGLEAIDGTPVLDIKPVLGPGGC
jgi:tRNA-Thr(GGU) m(6)t(6)A37 methyltransferase TsaA